MQLRDGRGVSRRQVLAAGLALGGAGVLAACAPAASAPQGGQEPSGAEVATQEPAPAASTLAGELKIWVFPQGENDLDALWAPLTAKFADVYPDIKPNIELLPWGGAAGRCSPLSPPASLAWPTSIPTPFPFAPTASWLPWMMIAPRLGTASGNLLVGLTWEGRG